MRTWAGGDKGWRTRQHKRVARGRPGDAIESHQKAVTLKPDAQATETELRAFSDAGWQFYLPGCPDHPIDMSACYFPAL